MNILRNLDLAEAHIYAGWLLLAAGAGLAIGATLGVLAGLGIGLLIAGIGAVLIGDAIAMAGDVPVKASPTSSQEAFAAMSTVQPQEEG